MSSGSAEQPPEAARSPEAPEAGETALSVESRHLRSAIEFALEVARAWQRQRPPLGIPDGLRPLLGRARIPTGGLGRARRVIEQDSEFRRRVALAATPELVDEVGLLWLEQPEGWSSRAAEILGARARQAEEREEANALRRERRRREAAEQVTLRTRAEFAGLLARIAELESALAVETEDRARLEGEIAELNEGLAVERRAARHARDREGAARTEAERLREALASAAGERRAVETARDAALADRVARRQHEAEVARAVATARGLVDQLTGLLADRTDSDLGTDRSDHRGSDTASHTGSSHTGSSHTGSRLALPLPSGVVRDSELAVDHLMRSGALVLVDGYNLTMTVWPDLDAAAQRQRLVDALEEAARRAGTEFVIVFDGADVAGGHGPRRLVRVVYSPEGVTADDVIRAEIARVPSTRPVVVVTDDGEIQRDARRDGANLVPSAALYRWCRR